MHRRSRTEDIAFPGAPDRPLLGSGDGILLVQGEKGQPVSVIQIPGPDAGDQEEHRHHDHDQAEKNGHDQDVHVSLFPVSRKAVSETRATELSGMITAATTGLTQPRKHRVSAARL